MYYDLILFIFECKVGLELDLGMQTWIKIRKSVSGIYSF